MATQDELERLLKEHREERRKILDMEAKKTMSHADRIKRRLEERGRGKSPDVIGQDVGGVQVCGLFLFLNLFHNVLIRHST